MVPPPGKSWPYRITDVTHRLSHELEESQSHDLYSDYLLSSFGATTATGLSDLLEGALSHDQITRFLAQEDFDSKTLWQLVKPMVRAIEDDAGVLIFDAIRKNPIPTKTNSSPGTSTMAVKGKLNVYHEAARGLRTHRSGQEHVFQERTPAPLLTGQRLDR